jgi:hypothetical protein
MNLNQSPIRKPQTSPITHTCKTRGMRKTPNA